MELRLPGYLLPGWYHKDSVPTTTHQPHFTSGGKSKSPWRPKHEGSTGVAVLTGFAYLPATSKSTPQTHE